MDMTLDEAIKHAEEVAEENEKSLRGWKECINRGTVGWSDSDKEKVDTSITRCSKCAEEHRQLAEWLKDYKRLKEQEPKTVLYSGDGYADGYMVYDMAECPNCSYEYEDGDKDWGLPFCPSCGQKLNWESEDEK